MGLPVVFSDTQSALVPGSLINDDILIAFEIFHFPKNQRQGKERFLDLKLDMIHAYKQDGEGFSFTNSEPFGCLDLDGLNC